MTPRSTRKTSGESTITHALVAGIARAAAAEVPGVIGVREQKPPLQALRSWLRLPEPTDIPLGTDSPQLTIDVSVDVAFGTPIPAIVERIRKVVATRVNEATGVEVEAVNVTVADIAHQVQQAGSRTRVR